MRGLLSIITASPREYLRDVCLKHDVQIGPPEGWLEVAGEGAPAAALEYGGARSHHAVVNVVIQVPDRKT